MARLTRLAPLATVALAACAAPPASPAAPVSAVIRGSAARFDGTYALRLTPQPTGEAATRCPAEPGGRRLVVRDGRASLTYRPRDADRVVGPVAPDGALTATGSGEVPSRLDGHIEGGRFTGTLTHQSGPRTTCTVDVAGERS